MLVKQKPGPYKNYQIAWVAHIYIPKCDDSTFTSNQYGCALLNKHNFTICFKLSTLFLKQFNFIYFI